jgi:hypothetical protein
MNKRTLLLTMCLLVFFSGVSFGITPAEEWRSLEDGQKSVYLFGYLFGNYEMLQMLHDYLPKDIPRAAMLDFLETAITGGYDNVTKIRESVDYFYGKPENEDLFLYFIVRASVMRAAGISDEEIEKYLSDNRAVIKTKKD